jgi:hypothetical protein
MKTKSDKQLALVWACDERTIRRWRKAGAPLDDPKRMRSWLAGQKKIPSGTAAVLKKIRSGETVESAAQPQKLAEGPVAALKRLGEMEARAFTDLQRALASGDPIEIKLARENWLKILESQRRVDLAIEQNRRDAGELIPREQVLFYAKSYHRAIYEMTLDFENLVPALIGVSKPDDIFKILGEFKRTLYSAIHAYFTRHQAEAIPKWLMSAVRFENENKMLEDKDPDVWALLREQARERTQETRIAIKRGADLRATLLRRYHEAVEKNDTAEATWCWAEVLFPRNDDGTPQEGATVGIDIGNNTTNQVTWAQIQSRDKAALRFKTI